MKITRLSTRISTFLVLGILSACDCSAHPGGSDDAGDSSMDASGRVDSGLSDSGATPDANTQQGDAGDADTLDAFAGDADDDSAVDAGQDAGDPDAGVTPGDPTVAWVLSYFGPNQDLPNDSLHLATSTDGLHFTALAAGLPVYEVGGIGTNHIRDPFIFRKNDGTFVYVATDWTLSNNDANYWNNPSSKIFVAESTDLITFTNPHLLQVTNLPGPGGSAMHAWAPEVYYDDVRGKYAIVWSGNDSAGSNHIYVSYTTDFASVESLTPEVLFDPGYSVIDGTMTQWNGRNYLFFKDETDNSGSALTGSGKDIQVARSPTTQLLAGSFSRWSANYVTRGTSQGTRQGTEGPFVIKDPSQSIWYLFGDYYGNGGVFGCWSTTDLDADPSTWTKLATTDYSFPAGVRHANTVRVTQAELDALVAHHHVDRIRSTFSEGGNPFYVSHSYYHGVIARLAEPSLAVGDNAWHVRAGLSDGSDASLVSFEASGYPGRYLRVDSANPTRYPPCGEASTYGWALCNVAAAQRHHLTWVDAFVESTTYRSDATFRRVPALNGNAAMVSFQWVGDPTRYLRHNYYQLFAATVDGTATQNNDASFTVE